MFFSRKPLEVIYLERDRVSTYPRLPGSPVVFADDTVRYLEVKDPAKLKTQLAGFFTKDAIHGKRYVILLDKEVVFQKIVVLEDKVDPEVIRSDFEDKVPFDSANRHVFSLQQKGHLFLFGVSLQLYRAIVDAVEAAGGKVDAVVPAALYSIAGHDKLNDAKLAQIKSTPSIMRAVDFLSHL